MRHLLSSINGVVLIQSPEDGRYQVGKVERHVDLVVKAYEATHSHLGTDVSKAHKLAMEVLGRNIPPPPEGSCIAPLTD